MEQVDNAVVSKYKPLQVYKWGDNCDGWVLDQNKFAAIKQEKMPSGTTEKLHYHATASQFFYVLAGKATFEINGQRVLVGANEGLQIHPNQQHKIMNESSKDLEFLLFSSPSTTNDRIDCE